MMKGGRIMITVSCKYYADVKLRFLSMVLRTRARLDVYRCLDSAGC